MTNAQIYMFCFNVGLMAAFFIHMDDNKKVIDRVLLIILSCMLRQL